MSSPFVDVIMARVMSAGDPNAAMERDAVQSYVKAQNDQNLVAKSDCVEKIGDKLALAIENKLDTTIITAYQKLLAQLTA